MHGEVAMCCLSAQANRNVGTINVFMFWVLAHTGLSTYGALWGSCMMHNLARSHHVHPVCDVWACTDRANRLDVLAHRPVHLVSWHAVYVSGVQVDRVH